jgi:Mce-associated membrane protein
MTVTAAETHTPTAIPEHKAAAVAGWAARASALALDTVPALMVMVTAVLMVLSVPAGGGWWWAGVVTGAAAMVVTACNRLLWRGQSLGRAVCGITVVRRTGEVAGPGRLLARDLAHLLDTAALGLGWYWPLRGSCGRTFADMLVGTQAHLTWPRGPQRGLRWLTVAVVLSAAAVCSGGAAISYGVVHQHDQSVTEARAQISKQGPHMVEQLLSYHPETIQGDFDRARSLASDHYRGQLVAQQQAVQKAGLVRNEYWVTNSAVLNATPTEVRMLMFLQGERGAPPQQRYLTASVRVRFVNQRSLAWKVDDLTVVAKSQMAQVKP